MISNRKLPAAVPCINRARGFYVYTRQGERYLDLYREGGSLIHGHRVNGVGLRVKNFVEKGNFGRYSSVWESRAVKAVMSLCPGYGSAGYFPAADCLALYIEREAGVRLHDPAVDGDSTDSPFGIWRPFLPVPRTEYLVPWIPYAGTLFPLMVLGPRLLNMPGWTPCQYQFSAVPVLASSLSRYCAGDYEASWGRFTHPLWKRSGPYVIPNIAQERHEDLFSFFLSRRIILSPEYEVPSVLPDTLSDGDTAKFLSTSEEYYGKH